jgi:hypothetical protein
VESTDSRATVFDLPHRMDAAHELIRIRIRCPRSYQERKSPPGTAHLLIGRLKKSGQADLSIGCFQNANRETGGPRR